MTGHVLILGGRAPAALDHARRFAHQGWKVFAADSISCELTGASNAVAATLRLASPRYEPVRFVRDLLRLCREHAIDLIVPTCEEVFYVSRYRNKLPAHIRVLADDFDKLRAVHSKWQFLALAQGCGVDMLETALVTTLDEAREWAGVQPTVLKPEFSRFGIHVRLYPHGIPNDADPLASLGKWLVQEYAEGHEFCSYSVADRGRLLAHSLYRPQWRMSISSSFYFESARIEAVHSFVSEFARKLSFTGQLSFDWIQRPDGSMRVLECNPRATSGCHLFTHDDALPAALNGSANECVEPTSTRPRMVGAVMLTVGLRNAFKKGQFARWSHDYRRATDVISIAGDRGPFFGGVGDLMSYASLAVKQRCTMREAATRDIEWDGQTLPDA